jgi:hypothetical protein
MDAECYLLYSAAILPSMKRIVRTAIVAMGLLAISPLLAQTAPGEAEQQQIIAVIKEIRAQQTSIAENQAKIDAKLGALAEAIRVAKIFASRGGR